MRRKEQNFGSAILRLIYIEAHSRRLQEGARSHKVKVSPIRDNDGAAGIAEAADALRADQRGAAGEIELLQRLKFANALGQADQGSAVSEVEVC